MSGRAIAPALAGAYAHCEALTRQHDRDRWLAALFAPADARPHLHALAAFSYETGRLRDIVREPIAGEMRLQWWREALAGARDEEAVGHPVAAALNDTIERFGLPRRAFDDLLSARAFDLYDDPMPTLGDFELYCGETASVLFRLGALILAEGREPGGADAAGHAGVADATVRILREVPATTARGQLFIPMEILARHAVSRDEFVGRRDGAGVRAALADIREIARDHWRKARARPIETEPAFLPLALTPLYLARMERADYAPFASRIDIAPWRRQWALWRAARAAARVSARR